MPQNKRSQLRKYFAKFPTWAVVLIVVGVLLLASPAYFVGLVFAGLGGWGLFAWSQKPTDQQVAAWIEEALKNVRTKALAKSGIDESELVADPVVVYGPRFWNIGGADAGIKKGGDGVVRFMPLGVTVINFTANQLLAYQCALDLATNNPLNESTDEYFYRDVVSVSTQSQSRSFDLAAIPAALAQGALKSLIVNGKLQFSSAEMFVLTTSGGTSIEVLLQDPQLIQKAGGGSIPTHLADKAVQAVRKMLREKKAGAAGAA